MEKKTWQKNIISMLVIVVVGFGLFILAFISAAFVINIYNMIFRQISDSPGVNGSIMQPSGVYVYLALIMVLSWFVFRSKLNDLIKATYLTMPLIVIYMVLGLSLFPQPQWIIMGIGAVIVAAIAIYLFLKKQSWMYFFAVGYTTAVALIVMLSGMEI